MKNKIFSLLAVTISGFLLQACGNQNKASEEMAIDTPISSITNTDTMDMDNMNNAMMQSMDSMRANMKNMQMTGDFDLDFANLMILHHQAAVDMSKAEVAHGTDAEIKTMAQNIINMQKEEMEQLQEFVKKYKKPEEKKERGQMHHESVAAMNTMRDTMMNIPMSGNTDKDFVMMMIPHHRSAVVMAKNELSYGKHTELKKMAEKMISDQTREIEEFEALLASRK